jgi:hypothetical protein
MNPTLKHLSKAANTPVELADLLERHIGAGTNELHCTQACEALRRIRHQRTRIVSLVIARMDGSSSAPCDAIRSVINYLRNAEQDAQVHGVV